MVPDAPPTWKNQRATSCPAPISANVPYLFGSRLIWSAFCSVPGISRVIADELFTKFPLRRARKELAHVYCEAFPAAARCEALQPERFIHFCKTGTNGLIRSAAQSPVRYTSLPE